jgi:hypothetical protein
LVQTSARIIHSLPPPCLGMWYGYCITYYMYVCHHTYVRIFYRLAGAAASPGFAGFARLGRRRRGLSFFRSGTQAAPSPSSRGRSAAAREIKAAATKTQIHQNGKLIRAKRTTTTCKYLVICVHTVRIPLKDAIQRIQSRKAQHDVLRDGECSG